MKRKVPSAIHALYPDLVARLKAAPQTLAPVGSTFRRRLIKKRYFWYVQEPTHPDGHRPPEYYLGRDTPETERRAEEAREAKEQSDLRRLSVRALLAAGFTAPERFIGDLIAHLFETAMRNRGGILLGPHAFHAYGPVLGHRLDKLAVGSRDTSGDAQVVSIAARRGEIRDVPSAVWFVDKSFRKITTPADSLAAAIFENDHKFRIEIYGEKVLDAASGQVPVDEIVDRQYLLRFLLQEPIEAALLHRSGELVRVPSPERYAIYKLMTFTTYKRSQKFQAERDIVRAASLIEALAQVDHGRGLKALWKKTCSESKIWREQLEAGSRLLPRSVSEILPIDRKS